MDNQEKVRIRGRFTRSSNITSNGCWSYESNATYTKEIRGELVDIWEKVRLPSGFGSIHHIVA